VETLPILNSPGPARRDCAESNEQRTPPLEVVPPSVKFDQSLKREFVGCEIEMSYRFA
jgi:hypothetical protein